MFVESEDQPDRLLLETRICREDGFQKQQGMLCSFCGCCVRGDKSLTRRLCFVIAETLIVWTEPNGVDYALSFQDPEGCAEVWSFITEVQRMHSAAGGQY